MLARDAVAPGRYLVPSTIILLFLAAVYIQPNSMDLPLGKLLLYCGCGVIYIIIIILRIPFLLRLLTHHFGSSIEKERHLNKYARAAPRQWQRHSSDKRHLLLRIRTTATVTVNFFLFYKINSASIIICTLEWTGPIESHSPSPNTSFRAREG